jgi:hypothetical protein
MFRVLQMTSVITSEWFVILGTIGEQAHVVLAIFVCGYFLLIAMTAVVATFHREADRRVDALGVEAPSAQRQPSL